MAGAGVNPNYLLASGTGILSLLQQDVSVIEVIKSIVFLYCDGYLEKSFIVNITNSLLFNDNIYIFLIYIYTFFILGFLVKQRMNLIT